MLALTLLALLPSQPPPADPVARLRAEAHAARREQVELLLKQVPEQGCDDYAAATTAVRRLADEVAAAGDTAAAVRWHERWAKAVREYENKLKARFVATGPVEEMSVAEARIGAEIDLVRRRGAAPDALIPLYKDRVALLTKVERLVEKAEQVGRGSRSESLRCKVARLDAEAELAAAEAAAKKKGK